MSGCDFMPLFKFFFLFSLPYVGIEWIYKTKNDEMIQRKKKFLFPFFLLRIFAIFCFQTNIPSKCNFDVWIQGLLFH